MLNKQITKTEFIAGIFLTIIVLAIGIIIGDNIRNSMEQNYLHFEQAVKLKDSTQFDYAVKTNAGDILVEGKIIAEQSQTMPDIEGEYSIIKRVDQRYTMHTRTVSYSCGTTKNPRTCTQIETYWTWDTIGGEKKQSKIYKVLETNLDNMCEPPVEMLSLNGNYTGNQRHDNNYIFTQPDWLDNGDYRTYYEIAPKEFNGTVFLRAFDGKTKNPFDDACIELFYNRNINEVMEDVRPNFIFITIGLIFIVSIITCSYFYWAINNDFK